MQGVRLEGAGAASSSEASEGQRREGVRRSEQAAGGAVPADVDLWGGRPRGGRAGAVPGPLSLGGTSQFFLVLKQVVQISWLCASCVQVRSEVGAGQGLAHRHVLVSQVWTLPAGPAELWREMG